MTIPPSNRPIDPVDALTAGGAIVTIRPVAEPDVTAIADMFSRSSAAGLRQPFYAAPGGPVPALEITRSPGRPPGAPPPRRRTRRAGGSVRAFVR